MGYKRKEFEAKGFDEKAYQRYCHRNQASYIRTKLTCIALYHQGKEFDAIAKQLSVHAQSVRKYVNLYISGGFDVLCRPDVRPQSSLLTAEQMAAFKAVLLSQKPCEVGLVGNIWTGNVMCAYLKQTYGVVYKSGIYDLLERLGLSHQKAHADYGNAKVSEQTSFLEDLKTTLLQADETTAVLKFDEFSVCEKPTAFYGWAEKNTRPCVVTDEKKEGEPTDC
jgi:transposase